MIYKISNTIASKQPLDQNDYKIIKQQIDLQRGEWVSELLWGRTEIQKYLEERNFSVVRGINRQYILQGKQILEENEIVLTSRLKKSEAIVNKMGRFGESLSCMLDIWGYRVVVSNEYFLEYSSEILQKIWQTPENHELVLRNGTLQFDWYRDYRKRSHAGISSATSFNYDEAIHMNRRTKFGISEIQIMTNNLYLRAFLDLRTDESHSQFLGRRSNIFQNSLKNEN
jgi:Region found in RelA / SpoT proteins